MNISETLKQAAEVLTINGVAQPRREAVSLLAFVLGKDRTFLIAHSDYELSADEEKLFFSFLERRAGREPFQHITGKQEFYGLDFYVTRDVLIPRPETEMIVENAIGILQDLENPRICEIGIGSGCISVSILKNVINSEAIGLDISEKALHIAGLNAKRHTVSERLVLKKSDVFEALKDEKFDLIVSNPPYIPQADFERLQPEVRDFDPPIALTDGRDGLSITRQIIDESTEFLKPGGFLLLEIGIGQAAPVKAMFSPENWRFVEILPDLQAIPRMVKAGKKV